MYMGVPPIYGEHPTTMPWSPVDLAQGSVTCAHAHSLPKHFAGGPLYTHAPAYNFRGEGEGARVAQIYSWSEVPTLSGGFLSGCCPSTLATLQLHDPPTHAPTCCTPLHFVGDHQSVYHPAPPFHFGGEVCKVCKVQHKKLLKIHAQTHIWGD